MTQIKYPYKGVGEGLNWTIATRLRLLRLRLLLCVVSMHHPFNSLPTFPRVPTSYQRGFCCEEGVSPCRDILDIIINVKLVSVLTASHRRRITELKPKILKKVNELGIAYLSISASKTIRPIAIYASLFIVDQSRWTLTIIAFCLKFRPWN